MNFLQKKIWIAWSKLRFLRLPPERRVRLEVTTDGRHLTFILVSLYEAGYGVQVFGGDWFFRELKLLRKTAPIPFLYGGKETECGISISDQPSTLASRPSTLFVLDYDYFTGLLEKVEPPIALINTDREPHPGGWAAARETAARLPEGRDERERTSQHSRIDTKGEAQGCARGTRAGASAPDSLASELADSPVSESLTRSASGPAAAAVPPRTDGEYRMAEKALDPRPSSLDASAPATRPPSLATAPEVPMLDSRPSTLDSSSQALRMPYFMQPKALHAGYHKFEFKNLESRRRIRLGFYGTHNPLYYTQHFRFPILPRTPILERFIEKFRNDFHSVTADNCDHLEVKIAVSLDDGRGDLVAKKFLPQEKFFSVLEATDFMLCPPGWCMPQAHNIVESMSRGAIPILNYPDYMVPQLVNGINCLAFSTLDEMELRVREALEMPQSQVQQLRLKALEYYQENLQAGIWWAHLLQNSKGGATVLINNEEESVGIMEPDFLVAAADYIAKHLFK